MNLELKLIAPEILKYGNLLTTVPESLTNDIRDIFQTVRIKRFSRAEINQIQSELENEKISDVLAKHHFDFPYLRLLLEDIVELESPGSDVVEFLSCAILYSFLSFLVNLENHTRVPQVEHLLKAFGFAIRSTRAGLVKECAKITMKCVFKRDSSKLPEMISGFLSYFEEDPDVEMLIRLIREVLRVNGNTMDAQTKQILDHLTKIHKDKTILGGEELCKILEPLRPFISVFNEEIINFLINLRPIPNEIMVFLVPCIKEMIILNLNEIRDFEMPKGVSNVQRVSIIEKPKSVFGFSSKETLPDGFNPTDVVLFPQPESLNHVVSAKLITHLNSVAMLIRDSSAHWEMFLESVFDLLEQQAYAKEFPKIYTVILIVMNTVNELNSEPLTMATKYAYKFYQSQIFDPSITIFECDKGIDVIGRMRSLSLEFILADCGEAIDQVLKSDIVTTPLLLAEVFQRLVSISGVFGEKVVSHPKIVRSLQNIALSYRNLENEHSRVTDKSALSQARVSMFSLFAHLFADPSVLMVFFSQPSFANAFMSFVFEEPLRDMVITALRTYMMNVNGSLGDLPNIFHDILTIARNELPGKQQLALLNDLVTILDDVFSHKRQYIGSFKDIGRGICSVITRLTDDEVSKEIYEKCLSIFAMLSTDFVITGVEIDGLISTLLNFKSIDFCIRLHTKFVQLLAGHKTPSLLPTFIVKQPQIMKLMMTVFFESQELEKMLQFFMSLVKYSSQNLEACANCGLDICVLGFLEQAKALESLPDSRIKMLLAIYKVLSAEQTTTQSILRFISLLAPIDKIHVSKYENLFITTLDAMAREALLEPESVFKLNGEMIESEVFDMGDGTEQSWSLAFWMYLHPNGADYRPTILTLLFGDELMMKLYMSGSCILLIQDDRETESSAKITELEEDNSWHFYVLSVKRGPTRSMLNFCIDCQSNEVMTLPRVQCNVDYSHVKVSIGGGEFRPVMQPSKLATCGVYPLLSGEDQIRLMETGLRPPAQMPVKAYKCYHNYATGQERRFMDVFVRQCGIDTLLPIMRLREYKFRDESVFRLPLDTILTVLTNMLSYSIEGQKRFHRSSGFHVISQLLMEQLADRYNMKIYHCFVAMMNVIHYKKLQRDLFESILTNYKLLILLDNDVHIRILQHWSHSLFAMYKGFDESFNPVNEILAALRVFYWYNPTETMIIYGKKIRKPDLNVKLCRSHLLSILYNNFAERFSEGDFESLISHCISCTEVNQVNDLLDLLIRVVNGVSEMIDFKLENDTLVFFVYFLFRYPFVDLQIKIIQFLTVCAKHELISAEFFGVQIEEIISLLPKGSSSQALFDFVYEEFTRGEKMLAPLAIFFAMESEMIDEFINNLVPSKDFVVHRFWSVWFFVLIRKCSSEQADRVLRFLVECDVPGVCYLYAHIDIIFQHFPVFRSYIEKKFVQIVIDMLEKDYSAIPIEALAELCKRMIFFRYTGSKSLIESILGFGELEEEMDDFSPNLIFKSLTSVPDFTFTIHPDEEMNWMHKDLGVAFLKAYEISKDRSFLNFDLLLCAFLQRTNFSGVNDHIMQLELKEDDAEQDIQQLVNYHSLVSERPIPFELPTYPIMNNAKFQTFLRTVKPQSYLKIVNEFFPRLLNYCSIILSMNDNVRSMDVNLLITKASEHLAVFQERRQVISETSTKSWLRLWNAVSIARAPWHSASETTVKWKRDKCACFGQAPVKMCVLADDSDLLETQTTSKRKVQYKYEHTCYIISPRHRREAQLSMNGAEVCISIEKQRRFSFTAKTIKYAFKRKDLGIQLFTKFGHAFTIDFTSQTERDEVIKEILSMKPNKPEDVQIGTAQEFLSASKQQKAWIRGEMSNYEYLLFLNHLSGRSFNDIDNYPIFPWILTDYSCESVDFNDKFIFRDLSVPLCSTAGEEIIDRTHVLRYLSGIEPFRSICAEEKTTQQASSIDDFLQLSGDSSIIPELIPEFFSMPEIVSNATFALPQWADSPSSFVYQHRRLLESPIVSQALHSWITLIWSSSSKYTTTPLFTGTHPCRITAIPEKRFDEPFQHPAGVSLCRSAHIVSDSKGNFNITILSPHGFSHSVSFIVNTAMLKNTAAGSFSTVMTPNTNRALEDFPSFGGTSSLFHQFNFEGRRRPSQPIVSLLKRTPFIPSNTTRKEAPNVSKMKLILKYRRHHFIAIKPKSRNMLIIDANGKDTQKIDTGLNNIACLGTDHSWIVAGGDASLAVFKDLRRIHLIQVYRDSVSACAISEAFNIIVAGTNDGSLILCSTGAGTMVRNIDIGRLIPKKILVSQNWGFIVAYCQEIVCGTVKHYILVYTINGELLRRTELSVAVDFWYSWSSHDSRDYMIYATETGKLDFCEIYQMKIKKNIYWCQGQVTSMQYSDKMSVIITTTATGQVHFIPFIVC